MTLWSVGISVSPCEDASRIGYDARQINRLVVRMAQFLLDREMRVVFGHDWREDGVMRAVARFAETVAAGRKEREEREGEGDWVGTVNLASPDLRMLNVVPTSRGPISPVALKAMRESRGVLGVVSVEETERHLVEWSRAEEAGVYRKRLAEEREVRDAGDWDLALLRVCVTWLLHEGCRICLAGQSEAGRNWGVREEAILSIDLKRPVYLLGGYGGAARSVGMEYREAYEQIDNGLNHEEKAEIFDTTDIERALEVVARGIGDWRRRHATG